MHPNALAQATLWVALAMLPWLIDAQGTLSAIPRTFPLVVRSPYFGVWAVGSTTAGTFNPTSSASTPTAWRKLNWWGLIRVDGETYQWMGNDSEIRSAVTTATHLTATRTIFEMDAGPMALTVSFLSPVEPSDLVLQSFPFAYMYVDLESKDGNAHSVQLFTDVDATFVTSGSHTVEWNTTRGPSMIYQYLQRRHGPSVEVDDMVEDGSVCYAMATTEPNRIVSTRAGSYLEGVKMFVTDGIVGNSTDAGSRLSEPPDDIPVISYSVDLGNIQSTRSTPILWAIGHARENILMGYGKTAGLVRRASYFWSRYATLADGISAFLADFPNAKRRAEELDLRLQNDASRVSQEYADLVSLSLRQTLGTIELSLARSEPSGVWDPSDVQAHMRDMGSSNLGSPVEVMYASMPALLYLNPNLLFYLLKPLLNYQLSLRVRTPHAVPNLGEYLVASGNDTDSRTLGVDSSASMLIMAAAYGQHSRDWASLKPYMDLFKTWADYLVVEALRTKDQVSVDGMTGENQSNIALKGIIGIYAMSNISNGIANDLTNDQGTYFSDQAITLAKRWEALAVGQGDHITSIYGRPDTWGLVYNVFAASLIAPTLLTKEVIEKQSNFYAERSETAGPFGLPYDTSDPRFTRSHWSLFCAASSTNVTARDWLIHSVHQRAFQTNSAFGTTYTVDTGESDILGGNASPAQGAMFALLVASESRRLDESASAASQTSKSAKIGSIVGGVVGGIAVLVLLITAAWFIRRRRRVSDTFEGQTVDSHLPRATIASFSSPEIQTLPGEHSVYPASAYSQSSHWRPSEFALPPNMIPTPFSPGMNGTTVGSSPTDTESHPSPVLSKAEAERRRFADEVRRTLEANVYLAPSSEDWDISNQPSSVGIPPEDIPPSVQRAIDDLRREVHLLRAQQHQGANSNAAPTSEGVSGDRPGHVREQVEAPPMYTHS